MGFICEKLHYTVHSLSAYRLSLNNIEKLLFFILLTITTMKITVESKRIQGLTER